MALLHGLLRPIEFWNATVLPVGRALAIVAIALMVAITLLQVFCRYILDSALAWPDEGARFLMLWMTGLIAPTAFRHGGFVAIDMVERALPRAVAAVLSTFLLLLSLVVLLKGVELGWDHVSSGWLFASSSLRVPLDWFGGEAIRIKLAWTYMSLFVGMILLTIVNIELLLRATIVALGGAGQLRPLAVVEMPEAE